MSGGVFVGRQQELKELKALLSKKTASLVVVKGRRRVGKSRLLEEFVKGKRSIALRGLPPTDGMTAQDQRDEFSRQLSESTSLPHVKADDWSTLLSLLAKEAALGRIVVTLDEISWMGSKDPAFLSKLKDIWEQQFKKNPKLILILCGSISVWIDENIINATGFYGRISWIINLKPLPLSDANQLLESYGFKGSVYEKFKIMSVTGGVPWYIEQMQGNYSADQNIKRHCFTEGGILVDEFDRIFKEMFGKRDLVYKKIVEALGQTALTYKQIAETINYQSSGRLSQYLDNLIASGFISKDYTWNLKQGDQASVSQYRLSDNYLRFYLKYIGPKKPQILRGQFKTLSLSTLPAWDAMMGLQFENLVVNNREQLLQVLNIEPEHILYDNPFLQQATSQKKACQIDYMVQTKFKNLYVCEIKFSNKSIGPSVIAQIEEKVSRLALPSGMAVLPVLIHVNGVSESVVAKDYFYSIIDFSELLSISSS